MCMMMFANCKNASKFLIVTLFEIMETTDSVTKSLRLLRDGFKNEFASFVYENERTIGILGELASEFVDANIPVVNEDDRMDLAMMLLETLSITAR